MDCRQGCERWGCQLSLYEPLDRFFGRECLAMGSFTLSCENQKENKENRKLAFIQRDSGGHLRFVRKSHHF